MLIRTFHADFESIHQLLHVVLEGTAWVVPGQMLVHGGNEGSHRAAFLGRVMVAVNAYHHQTLEWHLYSPHLTSELAVQLDGNFGSNRHQHLHFGQSPAQNNLGWNYKSSSNLDVKSDNLRFSHKAITFNTILGGWLENESAAGVNGRSLLL